MRRQRDFFARVSFEQEDICGNTWCDRCVEADIGLTDPAEYEEDGRVFVTGQCARCGNDVVTELFEVQAQP